MSGLRRPRAEWTRPLCVACVLRLALVVLAAVVAAEAQVLGVVDPEAWEPVPFRVRNLTFPTVLVMGFKPSPVIALAPGAWAVEIDLAVSNNFQMSSGVETYLSDRGDDRRPLDEAAVQGIVASTTGDQFLVDCELGIVDIGLHRGITERLTLSLHVSHASYGGGVLDPVIWDFHDLLGIGQGGRQYARDDSFQMVFVDDDGVTALLDRPSSGGVTDPVLSLRWIIPSAATTWRCGFEAGFKSPVASTDRFLSTGSWDFGAQLTAQREWKRNALVLNLALVLPGDLEFSQRLEVPRLPSLNVAWVNRAGEHTSGVVQVLFSQNIFHEMTDSDLGELEFQLTAGFAWDTSLGRFSVGVTENLLNFDNTPDFAVHLNYAQMIGAL